MRAFGYALPTAIADLIDNSITANAKNIWIDFEWHGRESSISIRDDGRGMTETELLEAMRLGSVGPLEQRDTNDLGRFGLGLKTASFSQCRLMAVASRANGDVATRCWDLDLVRETDRWIVRTDVPTSLVGSVSALEQAPTGTVVIWSRLDRVVGDSSPEDAATRDHFYQVAEEVVGHLRLTFSDFLRSGELKLHVNSTPVAPWDPFLERHAATQVLPVETLRDGDSRVRVSPFVLPHHSKLTPDEYRLAGGPLSDWAALQGFYVFRNRRLIVWGGWLGLGYGREKHFDLARIRIDIPNTLDAEWQLDVRKSRAHPPPHIRKDLKRIARIVRSQASSVYKHRGARLIPHNHSEKTFLWVPVRLHGKNSYRLERTHPLVQAVEETTGDRDAVAALFRLLEETIPTPLISMAESERPDAHSTPLERAPSSEILSLMQTVYRAMINAGQRPQDAVRRLGFLEPFDRFPELLATFTPPPEDLNSNGNP